MVYCVQLNTLDPYRREEAMKERASLPAERLAALTEIVSGFGTRRILCVGDVMLDRFRYGDVKRISPEAPVPVVRVTREHAALGGAGAILRPWGR